MSFAGYVAEPKDKKSHNTHPRNNKINDEKHNRKKQMKTCKV
jgi:hypothetical protein